MSSRRGYKHEPSSDWHVGDKVLRLPKKDEVEPRVPTSLQSVQARRRQFDERSPMKTVPNQGKPARSVDSWHTESLKTMEKTKRVEIAPRPPAPPVEQTPKRQLDLQHWNKALPKQQPSGSRGGWASDRQGTHLREHSEGISTVNKLVIDPSPRRVFERKPSIEQPQRKTLDLENWGMKTLEQPQRFQPSGSGWMSSQSGSHSVHHSTVHKVVS